MSTKSYFAVNGRMVAERAGSRSDYLHDALGNVTATATAIGAISNTYRFKPFGSELFHNGSEPFPPFGWVGQVGVRTGNAKFAESYVRSRHYSSAVGQWIAVDRYMYFFGRYAYCLNNPVTLVDPSGEQPLQQNSSVIANWRDIYCDNYHFWRCIQEAVRAGRSAKLACKTCLRLFPNWRRVGGGWQSVPPNCDWINDSWVPRERQDQDANWESLSDKVWYKQVFPGRVSAVFNYSSCPVRVCTQDTVTHKVVCIDSIPFSGNVTGKDADVVCDCDGTPRKVFDNTDWYVTDTDSWAKCGSTTTTEDWLENFIDACREAEKLYGNCCRNPDGCKNRPFLYRRPNPIPHR